MNMTGTLLWTGFVFVVVPWSMVRAYSAAVRWLDREARPDPPRGAFALAFTAHSFAVLQGLTLVTGYSGLHFLGFVVSVLIAGPVLAVQAFAMRRERGLSSYHWAAFALSAAFFPVFAASLLLGQLGHELVQSLGQLAQYS